MSYSSIRIVFGSDLIAGAQFGFEEGGTSPFGPPYSFSRIWNWVNVRGSNQQVTTGTTTGTPGEISAINFMAAAQLDMGNAYTFTRNINVVTIMVQNSNLGTTNFSWAPILYGIDIFNGGFIAICTSDPSITVTTEDAAENFAFESITLSPCPGMECTHVRVTAAATQVIRQLLSPLLILNNNDDDPLVFDWVRGNPITIIALNSDNEQIIRVVNLPSVLSAANFNIGIMNSPNGSTVNITYTNTYNSHISWSLDGTNWRDFAFSGLTAGTYTLYVRDNYGCSFQTQFTTSDFEDTYVPIFYISKSNSLKFANRITFGDASNYKNDENTLSCEEDVKLPYKCIQLFQSADVITTQFKSNYTINKVVIIPPNPIPTAATSNIMLYSGDLSNAAWTKNHLILSADKVIPDSTYNYHTFSQEVNKGTLAGDYTFSFYVKPDELKTFVVFIDEVGGSGLVQMGFDSLNKTFFANLGVNGFTFISATYTDEANGYMRVALKMGLSTATTINIGMQLRGLSGSPDHTGDSVSGMFFDKFQLQEGDLGDYAQTTNLAVNVPASDGTIEVPVVKMSNNLRAKDKRDAFVYGIGTNTYVYFMAGNIYDYGTGAITGTYALNGTLPIWGKVGNYIAINGTWAVITDTFFDETRNADVLVFEGVYAEPTDHNIVSSIFNIEQYEVYEFAIDMVNYIDQDIRVRINSNRSTWTELIHLSEQINVAVRQPETVEIKYRNSDNTDVFYSTGIMHKLRQPLTNGGGINDQQSDTNKTDSNIILLNADLYEGKEFIFEPVTTEIMRKLLIALSHEFVYINDVGYVKSDNIDVEGPQDDTNLYVVKAKMMKSGYAYNSQSTGISSDIYTGENSEIVGLMQNEDGFVKY